MRIRFVVPFSFLVVAQAFSQSNEEEVDAIDLKVEQIESDNLLEKTEFSTAQIGDQDFDGGGAIEIYEINGEIVKAVQQVGLSNGRLTVLVYFDNENPILFRRVKRIFFGMRKNQVLTIHS